MSMSSIDNPLSTCLVGISSTVGWVSYPYAGKKPNPVDMWDEWTKILLPAPEEPQELDILGSSQAMYCVQFFYRRLNQSWFTLLVQSWLNVVKLVDL